MMNDLQEYIEHIEYVNKVEKINQSVTVLNKDNKQGEKLFKKLSKLYRGGIDGYNHGAAFVGLTELGYFNVKLQPDHKGGGVALCTYSIFEFLEGIKAVKQ